MRDDGLLYQNGDWGIYTAEAVGLYDYVSDVLHECSYKKDADGLSMVSYQIIGSLDCPGCGETQPDDIQTLWQLHNMDKPNPTIEWGRGPLTWAHTSIKELNRRQAKMIKTWPLHSTS